MIPAATHFDGRTAQQLLEERRQNCLEAARETDEIAKAMLLFHVQTIDDELERRRGGGS